MRRIGNWLRNLAVQLGEALGLSSPTVAILDAEELLVLYFFLMEVIPAIADSKSRSDAKVVDQLLEKNIASLNPALAKVLRDWATTILPEMQLDEAQYYATNIAIFSDLIRQFPLGNKASNIEIAIAGYEGILTLFTRDAFPQEWAITQNELGIAYLERRLGDKVQNVEQAIAYCTAALQVRTRDASPQDWARTQTNLGNAYLERILEDKRENLKLALASYTAALEVLTRDTSPQEWATVQTNLGNAYLKRILEDKRENLELALASYTAALEVLTRDTSPQEWATVQTNLGNTYLYSIEGDKAQNLEQAIGCFTSALQVYTRNAFPQEWARTQNNLGNAYLERILGDRIQNLEHRVQNLEQAIACFTAALQVYNRDASPQDWARAQTGLGLAYLQEILGDRAQNLEQAITCFTTALQVYTRDASPQDLARAQTGLGLAYFYRIRENRADNLERAIAASSAALKVLTRDTFSQQWAMTQNNLGLAYLYRILGDKAQNLEQALEASSAALKVLTHDTFPQQWAAAQNNLGLTYLYRILGDKADNLEQAKAAFTEALQVRTRNALPKDWADTQNNLGNAYFYLYKKDGDKAQNLENAIAAYTEALQVRTREAFPQDWAMTQNNLGAAYLYRIEGNKAQNLEKAIAYFTDSLQVRTLNDLPQEWAETQNNLGAAYFYRIEGNKAQNLESAIAAYTKALQVYTRDAFPQNHVGALFNLGTTYQNAQRFTEAYTTFKNAIETVELLRGDIVSGDDSKRKQAEEWNMLYRCMVEVCLELDNTTEAIEYAERSKTRNLVELILDRDLKTIFPSEVVAQLERLQDEIASGQYQLQNGKAENPTALVQHLQKLRSQRNDLQNSHLPIGYGFKLDQFQATLDEDTTVVQWYITNTGLETFIITRNSLQRLNISKVAEQWDTFLKWFEAYLDAYDPTKDELKNSLASHLSRLAEILHLEDILKLVPKTCSRLVLIPHRFLHLFPLHALLLANGDFLCDSFSGGIRYSPSCQLLQQVQLRKRPDFQSMFAIQTPTRDLYEPNEKDLGAVGAIKKQFTDAYILKKSNATKSAILPLNGTSQTVTPQENLFNANCIFFFCHGYFNFASPLDSGLQLADENLTLADIIAHFNLKNCRLVTLSACETGLTDVTNFSDEYISLPYGFLLAGSTNVVSSLWTVSATATALLMIKFYEELQQQSQIAVALNTAQSWLRNTTVQGFQDWLSQSQLDRVWQRELRNHFDEISREQGATAKPFEKPYYWAAFCAIGKGE